MSGSQWNFRKRKRRSKNNIWKTVITLHAMKIRKNPNVGCDVVTETCKYIK